MFHNERLGVGSSKEQKQTSLLRSQNETIAEDQWRSQEFFPRAVGASVSMPLCVCVCRGRDGVGVRREEKSGFPNPTCMALRVQCINATTFLLEDSKPCSSITQLANNKKNQYNL